jgi:hypothetical protein
MHNRRGYARCAAPWLVNVAENTGRSARPGPLHYLRGNRPEITFRVTYPYDF